MRDKKGRTVNKYTLIRIKNLLHDNPEALKKLAQLDPRTKEVTLKGKHIRQAEKALNQHGIVTIRKTNRGRLEFVSAKYVSIAPRYNLERPEVRATAQLALKNGHQVS